MKPPLISFVNFNRLGLAARNLEALLKTKDDFELYIIDNNSLDDSWEYIKSLNDPRIIERKRFELNRGLIYALNYVLSHREKDQFFITVDSDVYIDTDNWISEFLKAFDSFESLGIVAAEREDYLEKKKVPIKEMVNDGVKIYETHILIGCCMCIRPELLNQLGYFNEETYGADVDLCARTTKYTKYKIAILPSIKINQNQSILCEECLYKDRCTLQNTTCFSLYRNRYKHVEFNKTIKEKEEKYLTQLKQGNRTVYCASIHDKDSLTKYYYDKESAEENFKFFIENAN